MLGRSSRIMAIAAMAALAAPFAGAASSGHVVEKAVMRPRQPRGSTMRELLGFGGGSAYGNQRRAGYGWTNAHAKRVAKKKRNQARYRRACKG